MCLMYDYPAGGLTLSHLLHSLSLFLSIISSEHPLIYIEKPYSAFFGLMYLIDILCKRYLTSYLCSNSMVCNFVTELFLLPLQKYTKYLTILFLKGQFLILTSCFCNFSKKAISHLNDNNIYWSQTWSLRMASWVNFFVAR